MRGLFWAVLAGGAALLGWGISRAVAPRGRVLLIGDAFAVGLTKPLQALGLSLDALAVVGSNVEYWTATGSEALQAQLAARPGLVLVSLGSGDAYSPSDQFERLQGSIRELLARLTASGTAVVWLGPPSLPSQHVNEPVNVRRLEAMRQTVESTQYATWIDSAGLTLPRVADGLHLTDAGYATWAEILVRELAMSPPETRERSAIFGEDEPDPIPPPPVNVKLPSGWKRLKLADMPAGMSARAVNVLAERRPLGDIRTWSVGNRTFGILTELHWDDHVGGSWKWHRGVSAVEKVSQ